MRALRRAFFSLMALAPLPAALAADVQLKNEGGAVSVSSAAYSASFSKDGKLASLKAGEVEFVSKAGCYLYANGKGAFGAGAPAVVSESAIAIDGPQASLKAAFAGSSFELSIKSKAQEPFQFVMVFVKGCAAKDASGSYALAPFKKTLQSSIWFKDGAALELDSPFESWGPWGDGYQVLTQQFKPGEERSFSVKLRKASAEELEKLGSLVAGGASKSEPPASASSSTPGRLSIEGRYLSEVPASAPAEPPPWFTGGPKAIYYDGPSYKGGPTKVFAYYGLPKLEKGAKAPGIVLVHGGGGTAYADWVALWNSRGYAAIAMDLCGCLPVKKPSGKSWTKLEGGGPDGWESSLNQLDEPFQDQWPYYAVNAIARARTFLGAQPEIDASKIGVTGISWGGYLTCLTAGIDHRYAFAVPVYGCGFLSDGGSAWRARLKEPGMERWSLQFDPMHYIAGAKTPLLWVTGATDFAYPMESLKKTYSIVEGAPVSLCVAPKMSHGHNGPGEKPEEILVFADSLCRGGQPLPSIAGQGVDGALVWASFKSPAPVEAAELVYTKDVGANKDRKWETVPADLDLKAGKVSASVPEGARLFYLNIHDSRKLTASSRHFENQR